MIRSEWMKPSTCKRAQRNTAQRVISGLINGLMTHDQYGPIIVAVLCVITIVRNR